MYLKRAYSGKYSDILRLLAIKYRELAGLLNPTSDGEVVLDTKPKQDFREARKL